mgnify:CR=1 FL=1
MKHRILDIQIMLNALLLEINEVVVKDVEKRIDRALEEVSQQEYKRGFQDAQKMLKKPQKPKIEELKKRYFEERIVEGIKIKAHYMLTDQDTIDKINEIIERLN